MSNLPQDNADVLIILGASTQGMTPSLPLQARLDTALEYIKLNPNTLIIVTGGRTAKFNLARLALVSEEFSEAEIMREYLLNKGQDLAGINILIEDESQRTKENLLFSKKILKDYFGENIDLKKLNIVIVSNNTHLYRVKSLATKLGYQATYLPAPTPYLALSLLREYLAVVRNLF
ncbi:MAG: YdcF family protein [Deltaproteobacteria bacterium]|jgi:uncharacterized SAM-binding protein YcdF (DUF218 family)|nr:YdcF family protein [Deltaproteobacteria bacterium]